MKKLTIGTPVHVTAIVELEYSGSGKRYNREVAIYPVEPFAAVIVGKAVKYTGTFKPATSQSAMNWSYDYESATLLVDKAHTFWQVKAGMINKPVLVRDEDLEEVAPFTIPHQGRKPKIIWPRDECLESVPTLLLDHQPLSGLTQPMISYPAYEPKLY